MSPRRPAAALAYAAALLSAASVLAAGVWVDRSLGGILRLAADRRAVESLAAAVREAESGQRGYLLTGDPVYLRPFHRAVGRVDALAAAVTRSPSWAPRDAAALVRDTGLKMGELRRTVALARGGDRDAALAELRGGRGRKLMEAIRVRVEGMTAARSRDLERSVAAARFALPLATGGGTLVTAVALAGAVRNRLARNRAEIETRLAGEARDRAEFEARLADARTAALAVSINAISHDLRTPMNGVLQHAMLAKMLVLDGDCDPDRVAQAIDEVIRSTRTQKEVLDQFLELARARDTVTDPESFDGCEALEAVARLVRPDADAKGLTLRHWCPKGFRLVTDRKKFSRIAQNLLANAVKFTERGFVALESGPAPGGGAVLRVTDTGPGIPADLRPRLFGEFQQGGNSERNAKKGFGLGLSIVRVLTAQLGGTVGFADRPGGGTVFTVTLPALAAGGPGG